MGAGREGEKIFFSFKPFLDKEILFENLFYFIYMHMENRRSFFATIIEMEKLLTLFISWINSSI